jgi:enoyl-CoA hydratase
LSIESYEFIKVEVDRGVGIVTLDRPDKLNAINQKMLQEICAAQQWLGTADAVNAVVLNGNGRSFCVGFDLQEADSDGGISGVLENRMDLEQDFRMLMGFWDCPKPTISAVHGHCLAGGCELALSCDLTVAAQGTRFGEPELRFGVGIGCMLMPWLTGPKQAKEIYFIGDDKIPAERALAMGLINHVAPEGEALDVALKMARKIASMDEHAMLMTKKAINRTYEIMGMRQAMQSALDTDVEIASLNTPDRQTFREISTSKGLKAAIAWRDSRFS